MNVVKLSGCLVLVIGAACSVEPRVDSTPTGSAGGAPIGIPGTGAAAAALAPYACAFDTRTVVENAGHFIEIITSRGRLFEFDSGVPIQPGTAFATPAFGATPVSAYPTAVAYPGTVAPAAVGAVDLLSIPLYAQGPCAGLGPGACVFDTHAFVRLPPNRLLEYVTAAGRQWVFENSQITGAGIPLTAIPRYQPICGPIAATGAPCIFDTRAFVKISEQVVESITAYGRRFEFDIDGVPLPNTGIDLMQSPRYATGPCQGAPPVGCVLETRAFEPSAAGETQLLETITSHGMLFTYLADTGADAQPPVPMTSRPYWAAGPCL